MPRSCTVTTLPRSRSCSSLTEHLCWTAFWDKRDGTWRVTENDPDSEYYAASPDADTVIAYMTTHTRP